MPLKSLGAIEIPGGKGSEFDHAAFDPNPGASLSHTLRAIVSRSSIMMPRSTSRPYRDFRALPVPLPMRVKS
jgi:hypothetical protein